MLDVRVDTEAAFQLEAVKALLGVGEFRNTKDVFQRRCSNGGKYYQSTEVDTVEDIILPCEA